MFCLMPHQTLKVCDFLAWGTDFIHKYLILTCWQLKFVVSSLINFTHTAILFKYKYTFTAHALYIQYIYIQFFTFLQRPNCIMSSLFQALTFLFLSKNCFAAYDVPANFVFGDSLVDAGNNNYIVSLSKANYVPNGIDFGVPTGRFTNGRTIVDIIGKFCSPLLDSICTNSSLQ